MSFAKTDKEQYDRFSLWAESRQWWKDQRRARGLVETSRIATSVLREFLVDSLPSRKRQRYGDADFDWDYRVDTTSATVHWRDRLLGMFHSAYQPTDLAGFREMLAALHVDFRQFTFVDIGSGKGRVLLMASEYPFRRIVGVELLPALHRIAQDNIRNYKNDSQQCAAIESICGDACEFAIPDDSLLVYLFNPLPESELRQFMANLEQSLAEHARPAFLLYYNPLLEHVLAESTNFKKVAGAQHYAIYGTTK